MILTCPKCSTRYLLNSAQLGPEGRKVRCANCAHVWLQEPDDYIPPEEMPEVTQPPDGGFDDSDMAGVDSDEVAERHGGAAAHDALEEDFPVRRRVVPNLPARGDEIDEAELEESRRYAAIVFAVLFLAGLAGMFVGRGMIVQKFPASYAIYEMLSIAPEPPGTGLDFDNISALEYIQDDGSKIIRVSGEIANLTDHPIMVPPIEARLKGALDVIQTWRVERPVVELDGGSRARFESETYTTSDDAVTVIVTFASTGEGEDISAPGSDHESVAEEGGHG